MGKTKEEIQAGGNVGKAVAIGVICSIVMTVALAIIILELSAPAQGQATAAGHEIGNPSRKHQGDFGSLT